VVADLADGLAREYRRLLVALLNGVGVIGPAGQYRGVAGLVEDHPPATQLLARSYRPWMKTTGVMR
jgi:hypothetical protein